MALVPGFVVIGLGVGLAIPTMSSTAMAAVPVTRGGMAAGAVNTARQLSFAIGIAVLGTVFTSRAQAYLVDAGAPDPARAARALSGGQAQRVLAAVPAGSAGGSTASCTPPRPAGWTRRCSGPGSSACSPGCARWC